MNLFHRFVFIALIGLMLAACGTASRPAQPTVRAAFTPSPTAISPTSSANPGPNVPTAGTALPTSTPGAVGHWAYDIPAFSPDSRIVALAGNGVVTLWTVPGYGLLKQLRNPYSSCTPESASFSADGGMFAASCWGDYKSPADLVVWDVATGSVMRHWKQAPAYMPNTSWPDNPYWIPVSAFVFLPNSSKIVFSSGHTLEIRDIRRDVDPVIIDLGPQMFASQLSIPPDGRFVYALMDWWKSHDWPIDYTEQYKVQIWDTTTYRLRREIKYPVRKFPDIWWGTEYALHGPDVVEFNYTAGTYRAISLENDKITELPYRTGTRYLSSDLGFIVFARWWGVDDKDKVVELWNADTWRNLNTFSLDFARQTINADDFIQISGIAFSPDNTMLAVAHGGQLTLFNIEPYTNP